MNASKGIVNSFALIDEFSSLRQLFRVFLVMDGVKLPRKSVSLPHFERETSLSERYVDNTCLSQRVTGIFIFQLRGNCHNEYSTPT